MGEFAWAKKNLAGLFPHQIRDGGDGENGPLLDGKRLRSRLGRLLADKGSGAAFRGVFTDGLRHIVKGEPECEGETGFLRGDPPAAAVAGLPVGTGAAFWDEGIRRAVLVALLATAAFAAGRAGVPGVRARVSSRRIRTRGGSGTRSSP